MTELVSTAKAAPVVTVWLVRAANLAPEASEAEAYCQAEAMDWVECNGIHEEWSEIELHSKEHHEHARELLQRAAELVCAAHEPR
jgi:hypothetical protein